MRQRHDDFRLNAITLVTNLGDFVSFFAVLQWLSDSGLNAAVGGYAVVVKSLGVALGAYLIPSSISRLNTKSSIVLSQVVSGFCSLGLLLVVVLSKSPAVGIVFGFLFAQTVLKQVFDGAKETHSKFEAPPQDHVPLQAGLVASLYSSQFVGPLISFVLVRFLPTYVPLALDTASFWGAAYLAVGLVRSDIQVPKLHVLNPLRYLWKNPLLRDVFLLRSVVFWMSMGLFNYLLFTVVTDHYHLSITHSAFIYAAMGLGATISSRTLRKKWNDWLAQLDGTEGILACVSQLLFAASIFVFFHLPDFNTALLVLTVMGAAMGVNAVVTQALRRRFSTDAQFPEVIALESIFGKVTDIVISTVAAATLLRGTFTYTNWLVLSVAILAASALLHLRFSPARIRGGSLSMIR